MGETITVDILGSHIAVTEASTETTIILFALVVIVRKS